MHRAFSRRSDLVLRSALAAVPLGAAGLGLTAWAVQRSPYVTRQDIVVDQPVPFSHEHHVGGLGLDCRFCHVTADRSPFAGMPDTATCMGCHSQIWTNAAVLEPVRESWRTGRPIAWNRVHALPEHVYFDHSAHVNKGVGCSECHGPVQAMPLVRQWAPLTMQWCLDCHRDPAPRLRPRDEVWNMNYTGPATRRDALALGRELCERYAVRPRAEMESCTTCHR